MAIEVFKVDSKSKKPSKITFNGTVDALRVDPISFTNNPFDRAVAEDQYESPYTFSEYISGLDSYCGKIKMRGGHNTNSTSAPSIGSSLPTMALPSSGYGLAPISSETDWADDLSVMAYTGTEEGGGFGYLVTDGKRWMEPLMPRSANIVSHPAPNRPARYSGIGQDRYRNGIAISPDGRYAYYGATVNGTARGDGEVSVYKLLRASKEVVMVDTPIILTAPANSGWKLGRRIRKTSNCLIIGAPGATSAHTGNTGKGMIVVMSQRANQESFVESQRIAMPDGSIGRMFEVSENGEWLAVLVEGNASEKRVEVFQRANAGTVNGFETYMYIINSSVTVENLFYGQIGISNNGMRILMYPYNGIDAMLKSTATIAAGYQATWSHDGKTRIIKRTSTDSQSWTTQTHGPWRSDSYDLDDYYRNMNVSFSDTLSESFFMYAYGGRVKERMGLSLAKDQSVGSSSSLMIQRILSAVPDQQMPGLIRPQTIEEWEIQNFGETRGINGNNIKTPSVSGFFSELESGIALINNTGSSPTSWSSENVKVVTINGEGTVTKVIRIPGVPQNNAESTLVFIKTEMPGNDKRIVTIDYKTAKSVAGIDVGIIHELVQAYPGAQKHIWTTDDWTVIYENYLASITGESLQIGKSLIARGVSATFDNYDSISGMTWRDRGVDGIECGTRTAAPGEDNRIPTILSMEIDKDCLIPIGIFRYNSPSTQYADIIEMELKITVSAYSGFKNHLNFMLADGSGYADTPQPGFQRVSYSPLTIFEGSKFETMTNNENKYTNRIAALAYGTGTYDSIRLNPWSYDFRPEQYLSAGVFSENIGRFYRVFLEAGEGIIANTVAINGTLTELDLLAYQIHPSLKYWSIGNMVTGVEVYEDDIKTLSPSIFSIPYNSSTHRFATLKEQELLGQLPLSKRVYSRSLTGDGMALDFVSRETGYYWIRISSNLPIDVLGEISDFSIIRPGIIDRPLIERRMHLSALNFEKYKTTQYTKTMARPASFYLDSQYVNPLPGSAYIAAYYPPNPGGRSTITLSSSDYLIKVKNDLPILGYVEMKSLQESSLIGSTKDTITFGGRYRTSIWNDPYNGYHGTWEWNSSLNRYAYHLDTSGVDDSPHLKRGFTMMWSMKPDGVTPIAQETATYGPAFWTSMQNYHGVEVGIAEAYDVDTDSVYMAVTHFYNVEFFEPINLDTVIKYPTVPASPICHNISDYIRLGWISGYVAPPNYLGLASGETQRLYVATPSMPVSIDSGNPAIENAGYAKVKINQVPGVSRTRVAVGISDGLRPPIAPLSTTDAYYAAANTATNERNAYYLEKSMDGEYIGDIEVYDILNQSTPLMSFPYLGGTLDSRISNRVSFDIDFPGAMTPNREILIKLKRNQHSASIVTMYASVAVELERVVP